MCSVRDILETFSRTFATETFKHRIRVENSSVNGLLMANDLGLVHSIEVNHIYKDRTFPKPLVFVSFERIGKLQLFIPTTAIG